MKNYLLGESMKSALSKSILIIMASLGCFASTAFAVTISMKSGSSSYTFTDTDDYAHNYTKDANGLFNNWNLDLSYHSVFGDSNIGSDNELFLGVNTSKYTFLPSTALTGIAKINYYNNWFASNAASNALKIDITENFSGNILDNHFLNDYSFNNKFYTTSVTLKIKDALGATVTINPTVGLVQDYNLNALDFDGIWTATIEAIITPKYNPTTKNTAFQDTLNSTPVPEPATMLLFGTGIAGLAAVSRRKKVD